MAGNGTTGNQNAFSSGHSARENSTPLWATFVFTFLNSISGFVTSGISYLTDQTYGFSRAENYWLSLLLGVMYIAGAMGAGPGLRLLRGKFPSMTTRALLVGLMVLMALLCLVPLTVMRLSLPADPAAQPPGWPVWVLIGCYSPLTGVLWPVVESYLSGGLRGNLLRKTIGWWNVTWCSALVFSSVAFSLAFGKDRAAEGIAAVAGVHMLGLIVLIWFAKEPAAHMHDDSHAVPAVYRPLLLTFRLLLPMSYIVSTALIPFLPGLFRTLKIETFWHTILGGTWLAARVLWFYVMQRWEGWHGKWWPAIASALLLLAGFGITVFAEHLGGLVAVIVGLTCFGIAMAAIYTAAIYYAMEVGAAEVEAGGAHEALIGIGYSGGPLIGLIAVGLVSSGRVPEPMLEPLMLAGVGGVAMIVAFVVGRRVVRNWGGQAKPA